MEFALPQFCLQFSWHYCGAVASAGMTHTPNPDRVFPLRTAMHIKTTGLLDMRAVSGRGERGCKFNRMDAIGIKKSPRFLPRALSGRETV
jgi:hypothetical protein